MDTEYEKTPEGTLKITETRAEVREFTRDELEQQRAAFVFQRDGLNAQIEALDVLLAKADELDI